MAPQCAARLTIVLNVPEKKKPFVTFCCEREAHEGNDHHTSGSGSDGQAWEISWTEKNIPAKIKGGEYADIH